MREYNVNEVDEVTEVAEEKKGRKNIKRIILILAVLLLLLLLGIKGCTSGTLPTPARLFNVGVDQNAEEGDRAKRTKEEIQAELNKKVADSMINISMNTIPTFENGSAKGSLGIVNESINRYPQVIEIFLQDEVTQEDGSTTYVDGQKIYQSGMIPVGSRVDNAELSVVLPAGEYRAIAYFNAVTEEGEYVGRAAANIKIRVLN